MKEKYERVIALYKEAMGSGEAKTPHHALNIVASKTGLTIMGVKRIVRKFGVYNPRRRNYPSEKKVLAGYRALLVKNMKQFEIYYQLSKELDCSYNYVSQIIRRYQNKQHDERTAI